MFKDWWVILIFLYVIKAGIKAMKPTVIAFDKIYILPVIFLFLNFEILIKKLNFFTIIFSFFALFLGIGIYWILLKKIKVKADKKHKLIWIEGSIFTLIITFVVFAIRLYFGFKVGKDPQLINDEMFFYTYIIALGFSSGLLLGRTLLYFYKYNKAESEDLSHLKPKK